MVNIVLLVNCGVIFALFGSVLSGNVNESGTELYADPDMPPLEACDDTDDDVCDKSITSIIKSLEILFTHP